MPERYSSLFDDERFKIYKDKWVSDWYEVNIYILNNKFN